MKSYIIHGLPHKDELENGIRHYWPIRCELAMITVIALKGNRTIIPFLLQQQILQQLQCNHMDIEKMSLLAHKSVYWINIEKLKTL